MKKIYREKLNFSKAELQGQRVQLGSVGVNIQDQGITQAPGYMDSFERTRDWLNFAWTGNTQTFVPDATMEALQPKKEDFVEAPFRLISATIVGGESWKASDFSNVAVLKASRSKLEGKPLYKDHDTDLDNWVGLVTAVKWSEPFMSGNIQVPAGIDGIVAVDTKTNPKVARGILMGSIYSNSVTVEFDWEMSHPFENIWDFYNKIGTYGSDGKMVRRVVTKILDYHESSLVWLGADPFAKAYTADNTLHNIDVASVYSFAKDKLTHGVEEPKSFNEETDKQAVETKNYKIPFAIDQNVLSLARKGENPFKNPSNNQVEMKKLQEQFIAMFGASLGMTLENFDDAKAAEHLANLKPDLDKAASFNQVATTLNVPAGTNVVDFIADKVILTKEAHEALEGKVTSLSSEVEGLKPMAAIGTASLEAKRNEAIRLYGLSVETQDEAVVALFKGASPEALDGLLKQYAKKATEKFSGKCTACGSTDFTFQSSYTGGDEGEKETGKVLGFNDLVAVARKGKGLGIGE